MKIYFGKNLKNLRTQKGLTQEKLANFLGVSYQTISKWEHNDTYPDITTLPEIAKFFNVSIDELLGVNQAENEAEIEEQIKSYDNLTDKKLMWDLISKLKEKFPNDFRVLIRYIAYLSRYSDDKSKKHSEVLAIYENIQQNCTDDQIRITAKRALIELYHSLSKKDDSEISFDDCEKIITQMPRMRDSKETFSFFYPQNHPEREENIRKTIEEEILLLHSHLECYYFFNDSFDADFKFEMCNKEIDFLNFIYDDGNYGKLWQVMIHNYGHLAIRCSQKGDIDTALIYLKKSAELAVKFDSMDRISIMHSKFFEGKQFDKYTLGSTYRAKQTAKKRMTEKYPLSDELKNTEEFKAIISILNEK